MNHSFDLKVKTIPKNRHRYDTCGDYFWDNGKLVVLVCPLATRAETFILAMHEIIEAFCCDCDGVSEQSITKFDMAFEAKRGPHDNREPGDSPDAPYGNQHKFAEKIERQLAKRLGINWKKYLAHLC